MKKNNIKTNAIRILESKQINHNIYNYDDSEALSGIEVAHILKKDPSCVFKTLVTVGKSNQNYVFVIPVNKELDLKKAALSVEEKSISMVKSKELLGLTGYIHGGCSPIGMKKFFKTTFDNRALEFDKIIFSAGKIGYQVEVSLNDLAKVIVFSTADLCD